MSQWRTLVRRVDTIAERAPTPRVGLAERFDPSRLTPEQLERAAYLSAKFEAAGAPEDPDDMVAVFTPDELMELAELRAALTGADE